MSIITVTLNPTIDRIIEVPGLRIGGHLQGRMRSRIVAGKAINVCRAMSLLDVPSTGIGWVGQDTLDDFNREMQRAGCIAAFTAIPGHTRENITLIDPHAGSETHVRDTGPEISPESIAALQSSLAAHARPGNTLVFNGSIPPGVSARQFGNLLDQCLAANAQVVVDTSGAALHEAHLRPLLLIKPNSSELADLFGTAPMDHASAVAAARQLARHIRIVLVSMGGQGAICVSGGKCWQAHTPPLPRRVHSTVGCGDVMLGAFLAAHVGKGQPIPSSLQLAVAAASASALHEQPAQFDPRLATTLAAAVRIDEL